MKLGELPNEACGPSLRQIHALSKHACECVGATRCVVDHLPLPAVHRSDLAPRECNVPSSANAIFRRGSNARSISAQGDGTEACFAKQRLSQRICKPIRSCEPQRTTTNWKHHGGREIRPATALVRNIGAQAYGAATASPTPASHWAVIPPASWTTATPTTLAAIIWSTVATGCTHRTCWYTGDGPTTPQHRSRARAAAGTAPRALNSHLSGARNPAGQQEQLHPAISSRAHRLVG